MEFAGRMARLHWKRQSQRKQMKGDCRIILRKAENYGPGPVSAKPLTPEV
jgi:hypothetical protein